MWSIVTILHSVYSLASQAICFKNLELKTLIEISAIRQLSASSSDHSSIPVLICDRCINDYVK